VRARADQEGVLRVTEHHDLEHLYNPLHYPNLPNTFAKVRDAKTALRFVELFGRLGYPGMDDGGSAADMAAGDPGGINHEYCEPAVWFIAQAQTVRLVCELLAALHTGGAEACEVVLARHSLVPLYRGRGGDPGQEPVTGRFAVALGTNIDHWEPVVDVGESDEGVEAGMPPDWQAMNMATTLINENMGDVKRTLTWRSEIHESIQAATLIGAIWWHVGQWALGGDLRLCRNCGTPFLVTHGRQEFCPGAGSSADSYGNVKSDRSMCAVVYHQREARRKAREKLANEAKETE
jgi:hypothetical protein